MMRRRGLHHRALTLAAVGALVLAGACTSRSSTAELADDPADQTVPGHQPTAPTTEPGAGAGLTPGANALLAELESVREETDLCRVLSGAAFEGLLTEDLDTTALVTNPAGLTRLIAAVDATFAHLVEIAPPELTESMRTVRDVWTRLASLGPVPDAEERVAAVLAEPQVVAANSAILGWAGQHCIRPAITDPQG